ncbi:phosphoribosylaminoimidazolesuccinocarboxamide synthase [Blattabacterium cuenoti]|uniref:phosphoribosylaminoimidazolesuccinocarboxamide synthase n=1 Tax=Blattabacterium cuenoti TaxID=1653831 RepID=UPI00163C8F68|nr:phosphoribosylaminoimidazolesuccinocarboxamide synthase [Blattabacterium cuenoti]
MNNLNQRKLLSEGKTKKIYEMKNSYKVILHYKDNITALNGMINESFQDKGILNNEINTFIFDFLNKSGIKTHFIRKINNREQLCHRMNMIPLEFVIRNFVSGSLSKRLKIKEGEKIPNSIYEIFYKNDELNDPLINDHHAIFLKIISYEELNFVYDMMKKINKILKKFFNSKNIILIDFKIEFGKNYKNEIVLSDEISPDTCRLWDKQTMKKLDKDVFRKGIQKSKDMFDIYMEILRRLHTI